MSNLRELLHEFKIKKKIYNDILKETHFFVDDVLSRIQDISNLAADQLDTGENIESNMKHIIDILRKKMKRTKKTTKKFKKSLFNPKLKLSKLSLNNIIEKASVESNSIDSIQEEELRKIKEITIEKDNIEDETKMIYAKMIKKNPELKNAENYKETLHGIMSDFIIKNSDD